MCMEKEQDIKKTEDKPALPDQPQTSALTAADALFIEEPSAVQAGYFRILGWPGMLYAAVYTICMFRNSSGITMPVWIAATVVYACVVMRQMSDAGYIKLPAGRSGMRFRAGSWFYAAVMLLLGTATFLTDSGYIICLNYIGFFMMLILFLLHNFFDDSQWDFSKSLTEITVAVFGAMSCMLVPFMDGYAFCQERKIRKNKTLRAVLTGVLLAVPALLFLGFCLVCADAVFDTIVMQLFSGLRVPVKVMEVAGMLLFGYFSSYCGMRYLVRRSQTEIKTHKTSYDPVIAMTFAGMLLVMYLVFCGVQVLYLFAGSMQLPEGMTYADYAHRGFYMLLFVCLVNLALVLFIRKYFDLHKVLNVMLLLICGCTFVMMASSAYRMYLYIGAYQLTFLRVSVLAALAALALLMAGVVVLILKPQFPLFRYSLAVVSVIYLGLAFSHADGIIASYNLSHAETSGHIDWWYLSQLSMDAAPAVADYYMGASREVQEQMELCALQAEQVTEGFLAQDCLYRGRDVVDETNWFAGFMYQVLQTENDMGLRSFNVSRYRAVKLLRSAIKQPDHPEHFNLYEQKMNEEEGYMCLTYGDKVFVPYCAYDPKYSGRCIGYYDILADEFAESGRAYIYEWKGYSPDEWIIEILDGNSSEGMLYREINAFDIPKGLESEYEWNDVEAKM